MFHRFNAESQKVFEAFAIGVSLRLMDRVTPGLLGMTTHFRKAGVEAEILQAKVARIGKTMAVGTAIAGAGIGILAALKPALTEASKFQTEVAKFSLFNMGDAANQDAIKFVKAMRVQGSSYVDNMARMTEAQGIFRESAKLTRQEQLAGAKLAAPVLAKIGFIADSLDGSKAAGEKASAQSMLRFIELRGGATDPKRFAQLADAGFKAIRSSGGNVSWDLLRQFSINAGTAGAHLRDDVLFGKFEPLVGEMKGQAGVGLQTAFSRLQGVTKPPNQVIHSMVSMGIWDPKKIIWNNQGGVKSFVPAAGGLPGNPLIDSKLWSTDPFEAYEKYVHARYVKFNVSSEEIARDNLMLFGRTGGKLFNIYERQRGVINNSVAVQAKTMGIDQANKVAAGTLAGQHAIAVKAFHDTLELTGEAILPMATRAMSAILPAIQSVNAFATSHPRMFDGIIQGIAGLGIALVVGGTVTNLVATAQALKLVGGLARTALFAEETGLLTRLFPAIGGAVEGLAGSLGLTVGALAGTVAIGAAAAAAIGFTIYEVAKHWTAGKSIFWNVRNELTEFQSWVVGWASKAISLLPKPIQAPVKAVAGQLTFGLADGTFMERLRLISSAVAPFLAKLGAIADGLSGHVRSWLDFGGKLTGAFGRVYGAITGFLDRIVALPGQWIAAHVPHLPGLPKSAGAQGGGRPLAPGAKPAGRPLGNIVGAAIGKAVLGMIPGYGQLAALPSPDKIRAGLAGAKFLDAPKSAGAWLDSILPSKAQAHAAGQDVSKGVAGGIVAAHPAVRAAAAGTATQAVVAFKTAADIRSPSRVFAGLGDMLIAGLIVGLRRSTPAFAVELTSLVRDAPTAMRFGTMPPVAPTPRAAMTPLARFVPAREAAVAQRSGEPQRSPFVRPAETHTTVHHTSIFMDGGKVAEVVTRHQAREASRPHAGTSTFDPTMSAAPVGLGYHP